MFLKSVAIMAIEIMRDIKWLISAIEPELLDDK